jgi:hypothetical protein
MNDIAVQVQRRPAFWGVSVCAERQRRTKKSRNRTNELLKMEIIQWQQMVVESQRKRDLCRGQAPVQALGQGRVMYAGPAGTRVAARPAPRWE